MGPCALDESSLSTVRVNLADVECHIKHGSPVIVKGWEVLMGLLFKAGVVYRYLKDSSMKVLNDPSHLRDWVLTLNPLAAGGSFGQCKNMQKS